MSQVPPWVADRGCPLQRPVVMVRTRMGMAKSTSRFQGKEGPGQLVTSAAARAGAAGQIRGFLVPALVPTPSLGQQFQHHWGTCQTCRLSGLAGPCGIRISPRHTALGRGCAVEPPEGLRKDAGPQAHPTPVECNHRQRELRKHSSSSGARSGWGTPRLDH